MRLSKARRVRLLACFSVALALPALAAPVFVPLDVPTISTPTFVSIDLDTETYQVGGYVSGWDFAIQTISNGNPGFVQSTSGGSFGFSSSTVGLLGAGVLVDATNPTGSFSSFAYFSGGIPTGTAYYFGFRTEADLDNNPATTGFTYGFFEFEVGSLTVKGYGFESTPGQGIVTAPVPEPVVGSLVLAAGAALFVFRRRRPVSTEAL
jgi:hypothetical protein